VRIGINVSFKDIVHFICTSHSTTTTRYTELLSRNPVLAEKMLERRER
jgi:hypothetical protein